MNKYTNWFPGTKPPVRNGVYELKYGFARYEDGIWFTPLNDAEEAARAKVQSVYPSPHQRLEHAYQWRGLTNEGITETLKNIPFEVHEKALGQQQPFDAPYEFRVLLNNCEYRYLAAAKSNWAIPEMNALQDAREAVLSYVTKTKYKHVGWRRRDSKTPALQYWNVPSEKPPTTESGWVKLFEEVPDLVTKEQAFEALNNLDDYARMTVGVDPIGSRETLKRFIEEQTG